MRVAELIHTVVLYFFAGSGAAWWLLWILERLAGRWTKRRKERTRDVA